MDETNLSKMIKAQRMASGLSLRSVAGRLGKSPSWLSKVERGGEKPSAESLIAIGELLSCPAPILFEAAGMIEPDVYKALAADYVRLEPKIRKILGEP